jgi:hypothetical protein
VVRPHNHFSARQSLFPEAFIWNRTQIMPASPLDSPNNVAARNRTRKTAIPADFPHPHRLSGSDVFRALLNDASKSTFARWLAEGAIEAPIKLGGMNAWSEQYMARVVRDGTKAPASAAELALS